MGERGGLRAHLRGGGQALGVLLPTTAGSLVEMAAAAGMDFVFLDCEHGPGDYVLLERCITAAEIHGTAVFVRVGHDEPALVQRALDLGATGIVFPHIDSAEQARRAVSCSHYPPLGSRGFSNYVRKGRFGRVAATDHARAETERTIVIAMIESPAGYFALREIVAVAGIDGIMCGPADLEISSTAVDGEHPSPSDMVTTIGAYAAETDSIEVAVVGTKEEAIHCLGRGVGMVVVNLSPVLMDLFEDWHGLLQLSPARPSRPPLQGGASTVQG
ncbi:HpcH/HpaI aldolase family protein [Mycobacterium spongiae]|uniref:2-dehydro-3-deoxyglucarate aldolase n=1 Tax=Mycobacterium spongiae TaxID=886343 RepID=A0A975JY53_9MYCO|nr:aldolase/citrate lyase family protein [Mycobacterium spongiae]QUR67234.1 2-dehydro-3-deoxyglucarate aldolase [Mycobacterium spongiae]